MKDHLCTVRGYIYEPKNGDPDAGIKPGTSFEEIPPDWECPDCDNNILIFYSQLDSLLQTNSTYSPKLFYIFYITISV